MCICTNLVIIYHTNIQHWEVQAFKHLPNRKYIMILHAMHSANLKVSLSDPGIWNGGGRLPSLPLEVDPLNPARESGRAFKLPQQGLAVWECSPAGGNLVHFSLKIWHLLATISITSGESTDQILWILNSKGKSGPSHPFLVHRTNWLRRDGMIYDSSPLTVSTNKTWDFKTEETAKYQVSLCIVSQLAFYN